MDDPAPRVAAVERDLDGADRAQGRALAVAVASLWVSLAAEGRPESLMLLALRVPMDRAAAAAGLLLLGFALDLAVRLARVGGAAAAAPPGSRARVAQAAALHPWLTNPFAFRAPGDGAARLAALGPWLLPAVWALAVTSVFALGLSAAERSLAAFGAVAAGAAGALVTGAAARAAAQLAAASEGSELPGLHADALAAAGRSRLVAHAGAAGLAAVVALAAWWAAGGGF